MIMNNSPEATINFVSSDLKDCLSEMVLKEKLLQCDSFKVHHSVAFTMRCHLNGVSYNQKLTK